MFDDEKIADEKSIANMKIKYAGLSEKRKVKVLQESNQQEDSLLSLAQDFRLEQKYLTFLSERTSGQVQTFFNEMIDVANNELADLIVYYPNLNSAGRVNPTFVCRPNSICFINRKLADIETSILATLFNLYVSETNTEAKAVLQRIINRRIEALGLMFLNPNLN